MTGSTGHKCPMSGVWVGNDQCRTRIHIKAHDTFPPCRECHVAITWTLVQLA